MYRMPYTLTRDGREIDGYLEFRVTPAERATRFYPGCSAYLDAVAFIPADGDEEVELTDAEIREVETEALRWANDEALAAADMAAEWEMERRLESRAYARAESEMTEPVTERR